eukprot:1195970-Prorocentrum_minimum.AAC.3
MSEFTSQVSEFTSQVSEFTSQVSEFTSQVIEFTSQVSKFTSQVGKFTRRAPARPVPATTVSTPAAAPRTCALGSASDQSASTAKIALASLRSSPRRRRRGRARRPIETLRRVPIEMRHLTTFERIQDSTLPPSLQGRRMSVSSPSSGRRAH